MPTLDNLILELIDAGHQASSEELTAITAHIAKAPFATYLSRVPIELRELLAQRGILVNHLWAFWHHPMFRTQLDQNVIFL